MQVETRNGAILVDMITLEGKSTVNSKVSRAGLCYRYACHGSHLHFTSPVPFLLFLSSHEQFPFCFDSAFCQYPFLQFLHMSLHSLQWSHKQFIVVDQVRITLFMIAF
jgi:hypothetical protein